jgi:hypothetical protein
MESVGQNLTSVHGLQLRLNDCSGHSLLSESTASTRVKPLGIEDLKSSLCDPGTLLRNVQLLTDKFFSILAVCMTGQR